MIEPWSSCILDDADGVGPNFDSAIDGYINTFNQMDIDSNGVINYDEFKEICARLVRWKM